ncbi:TASOR protein, partial [Furnarius figulus]|nr:TASOR protein [Furnarius figulus]
QGEYCPSASQFLAPGVPTEPEEPQSLLQRAVSVLQGSYLDSSQQGFQYSQAVLVENDVFLSEVRPEEEQGGSLGIWRTEGKRGCFSHFKARKVCQTGLRVNSSSISTLGDPAKGVYISKHADCLHPRPWYHGKSGYIVICKLIKGKVRVIPEDYSTTYTCPSPGYDCHVAESHNHTSPMPSPCQAFEQSQCYVYEVSGGSPAERPRQVCPYIIL